MKTALAWATDVHLNFCDPATAYAHLIAPVLRHNLGGLLITGDIAEAPSLAAWLSWLTQALEGRPLYFVLGNHDFYHGTLAGTGHIAAQAAAPACWLDQSTPIALGAGTWLVGQGGWGDARRGDFLETPVRLNDHRLIADLRIAHRATLQARLQALGTAAAEGLRASLRRALAAGARRILVATHVPPWPEAAWHEGAQPPPDSPWLPDFTCAAIGDLLETTAADHPATALVVLCGHSHGAGFHQIAPGLRVHTGGAVYGAPRLAGVIDTTTLHLSPPPPDPP